MSVLQKHSANSRLTPKVGSEKCVHTVPASHTPQTLGNRHLGYISSGGKVEEDKKKSSGNKKGKDAASSECEPAEVASSAVHHGTGGKRTNVSRKALWVGMPRFRSCW